MFRLTREPIALPSLEAESAGGFVSFVGRVRNHHLGREVSALEYEAFDQMAISEGEKLLQEATARYGLVAAECEHRLGLLQIGEPAVAIAVAAPHRREAFAACEFIIDELKKRVPIWKKEHYVEGASEWIGIADPAPLPDLYRRQTILPEVGEAGQQRLAEAKVLVVGVGGLGCPALLYLAAAGVGTLGVCDGDDVDASNLHRQVLFGMPDLHRSKVETARDTLRRMHPHLAVQVHHGHLDRSNAAAVVAGYDIILDCTDNFAATFLLNDVCVALGKPLVQAGIHQFEGQIQVIVPGQTACLRCLYPSGLNDGCVGTCAESGVIGCCPGLFGVMQAAEALKLLLRIGEPLVNDTLLVDMRDWSTTRIRRRPSPTCPACGSGTLDTPLELSWSEALALPNASFIDVREPEEIAADPGPTEVAWVRMPLSTFPVSVPEGTLVVVCAHGVRSARVAMQWRESGRQDVYSLVGGLAGLRVGKTD